MFFVVFIWLPEVTPLSTTTVDLFQIRFMCTCLLKVNIVYVWMNLTKNTVIIENPYPRKV